MPDLKKLSLCAAIGIGCSFGVSPAYGASALFGPADFAGITDGGSYTYVIGSSGGTSATLIDGDISGVGAASYMRLSESEALPVYFTLELTSVSSVDSVVIWNDRGADGDSIRDFDVELFDPGFVSLATASKSGVPNTLSEQQIFFGSVGSPIAVPNVKYARITVTDFYFGGPDGVAHQVREIGLNGDGLVNASAMDSFDAAAIPEPTIPLLFGAGLFAAVAMHRRRRV